MFELTPMNQAQLNALQQKWDQSPQKKADGTPMTYEEFRASVTPGPGCVMVAWCGMILGIEPDGYTHS